MPKLHSDIKKYYVFRAFIKRFILPILVLYGLDLGLSLSELSIIAGVGSVLSFILEIPSGTIADKLGHRRTLIISMLGQAVSMALYLGGSFWWFFFGTALYFTAGSLMTGTSEAFFYERVKALGLLRDHAKLFGEGKGFATAVSVLSMLLAGVAYEFYWALPFYIGVFQFCLAAIVVASIGKTHDSEHVKKIEGEKYSALRHLKTAWSDLICEPKIFWTVITSAIIIGPLFAIGDFQQAAMDEVGISATLIGLVYALKRLFSIGVQAKTYLLMKRFSPPVFTFISAIMVLFHYFGLGLIQDPWLMQIPLLIGTLSWVGLDIATNDTINRTLTSGSRATALSMNNFARTFIQVVTIGLFGLVTQYMSIFNGYLAIGIFLSVVLIFPLLKLSFAYKK